jgi:glycine cleavage system H lipoate-binding protein
MLLLQDKLGDVVYIQLPEVGQSLEAEGKELE